MQEILGSLVEVEGIFYPEENNQERLDVSYPSDGLENLNLVEDSSYWYWHRNRCIHHFVEKYCTEETILDVGGGNGPVTKYLQDAGFDSILIEPDISGCRNAVERGVKKVISSKFSELTFKKGTKPFSVGMFDVIEHIEDDKQTIMEVFSALNKGSFLIATVPSNKILWSKADVHAGHYRRYTKRGLSDLLEESGFEVLESNQIFSILVFPIFILRVLPSFLGIHSGKKNTNARDHATGEGFASKVLRRILSREFNALSEGRGRRFGSSILIVARKN